MVELQRWGRRVFWAAALLVLLTCSLQLTRYQGWFRPIRIASGSMAEALWGPHYLIRCADCRTPFRVGRASPIDDEHAVCPNCGYAENRVSHDQIHAGRRVLVDRFARYLRTPRIWETMVFADARQADRWQIKRVVAGPGEHVAIRDGDLWVDNHIRTKTLTQLCALCILVHDDTLRPRNGLPERWQAQRGNSNWQVTRSGYRYTGTPSPYTTPDWLSYHQWMCWPHPVPRARRTDASAIVDNYGYNQDLARGPLHHVVDIMVTCTVSMHWSDQIRIRLPSRETTYDILIGRSRDGCRIEQAGKCVAMARVSVPIQSWQLQVAYCDRQVLVGINGVSVVTYKEADIQQTAAAPASRITPAFAAHGSDIEISDIRLYRDVYYVGPGGPTSWEAAQPVPPNGWFVLGDNVPIAADSRFGTTVSIDRWIGSVVDLPSMMTGDLPAAVRSR